MLRTFRSLCCGRGGVAVMHASEIIRPPAAAQSGSANRARNFVDRRAALPGFPILAIAGFRSDGAADDCRRFGTGRVPPGERRFCGALLGLEPPEMADLVRLSAEPAGLAARGAIGAVLLNLPLPLEIAATLPCSASTIRPAWRRPGPRRSRSAWSVFLVLIIARPRRVAPATLADDGILFRAGRARPGRRSGRDRRGPLLPAPSGERCASRSVLARFADVLAELGRHRRRASPSRRLDRRRRRSTARCASGRAWRLVLADGTRQPDGFFTRGLADADPAVFAGVAHELDARADTRSS